MTIVLDASAVLAVLLEENGADVVLAAAAGALVSTVNLTEVLEKVADKAGDAGPIPDELRRIGIIIVPFSARQAQIAAALKPRVASVKNISLADRACLALTLDTGLPVLTGDRDWAKLDPDLDLDIHLIR